MCELFFDNYREKYMEYLCYIYSMEENQIQIHYHILKKLQDGTSTNVESYAKIN